MNNLYSAQSELQNLKEEANGLLTRLQAAEDRATREGWIDAEIVECELGVKCDGTEI